MVNLGDRRKTSESEGHQTGLSAVFWCGAGGSGPWGSLTCPSRHPEALELLLLLVPGTSRTLPATLRPGALRCSLPAGGCSLPRLFSGSGSTRCLSPALTLQLFLPSRPGWLPVKKEVLEGPATRLGKQEKRVEGSCGRSGCGGEGR